MEISRYRRVSLNNPNMLGLNKAVAGDHGGWVPGMTFRALAASILCMALAAIYTNHSAIVVREVWLISESAIPIPAILAVVGLSLFTGLMAAVFRFRLLSKAEIVCVTFATMMSVPLMTQGFWHRFFGMISATPVGQNFDYIDAYDDNLWPHGPNLIAGRDGPALRESGGVAPRLHGNAFLAFGEIEEGKTGAFIVITNAAATDVSYAEYSFDVDPSREDAPDFREPFLASVLARGEGVDAETAVFAEAVADGSATPNTLFKASPSTQRTWLHKTGYVRIGRYGVFPARNCQSNLVLRIGLKGRGTVEIADPRFFSVAPLMTVFQGRKIVDEAEWEKMTPAQRPPFAAVRPARRWSLRSLAFHLGGLVPFRYWAGPLAIWGGYVLLLMGAIFSMNVIMRRKWAESERYPMPNTRIPLALVGAGADDAENTSPFAAIWRNRWAWAGFAFALCYGLLKGAHYYNPRFPNMEIRFVVDEYISNPIFGGMFHAAFDFSLFVCAIAVFFELNVLMSTVVGYWVCRSFYFFGHVGGIDANNGFPWFEDQSIGAYLGYFAIIVILSSKYLWGVLKDAFRGRCGDPDDVLTPRMAVVLFVLCHVGVALWSGLSGASLLSMQVLFSFLVICGFISAKYRVECGSPFGYFVPYNVMLLIGALGGARVFGARGMFVTLLLSGVLTTTVFCLIPGIQFEMIEIGHRMRIRPRHIAYTCLIGILGGLIIGGMVYLSNGYAASASTLRGYGFYDNYGWYVTRIRAPLSLATIQWLDPGASAAAPVSNWSRIAMVFSGGMMAVLTVLRQYFAGFWFHPIGFLLGFTYHHEGANWGTILTACAIRWIVLKIGGAKAVRSKLLPFFIGVFAGCVAAVGIFTLINGHAAAQGNPSFYYNIP